MPNLDYFQRLKIMPDKGCPKCGKNKFTLSEGLGWTGSFDEDGEMVLHHKTNEIDSIAYDNKKCLYQFTPEEIEATECNFQ